eukprot:1261786-Rhodomonas_salina.4
MDNSTGAGLSPSIQTQARWSVCRRADRSGYTAACVRSGCIAVSPEVLFKRAVTAHPNSPVALSNMAMFQCGPLLPSALSAAAVFGLFPCSLLFLVHFRSEWCVV